MACSLYWMNSIDWGLTLLLLFNSPLPRSPFWFVDGSFPTWFFFIANLTMVLEYLPPFTP